MEFLIFGLLAVIAALVLLARRLRVPYPVALVLGGVGLGFIPLMPSARLPPNLVMMVFLPPILYSAAFFSSPHEFRANLRPISWLAVGVTLITATAVAWVAHVLIGLPWAAAFVLGAVVAPTDPVAMTAVAGRIGAPRQVVTILEGESLINDGTALSLYHVALAVVVTGFFSLPLAILQFGLYVIVGVAIGLIVGWVVAFIRMRIADRQVEIIISLLTSYAAYIPAQELGVSGVLAAVAAGLYLGWRSPQLSGPRARLQMFEVWEVLPFLLNSLLFILIGLQLPEIVSGIQHWQSMRLLLYAAVICLTVVGMRALWTYPFAYLPRFLSRRVREQTPTVDWRRLSIVAYTGMRGGVSLALALALPFTIHGHTPFPFRNMILFLTFCVILATLVPQGLTLPWLVRRLGLAGQEDVEEREQAEARLCAAEAALARIDELADEDWVHDEAVERLRGVYERRRVRFSAQLSEEEAEEKGESDIDYEERSLASQRLRRELLQAERAKLLELRNAGRISDGVRRQIERDLDLEDTRLEI
ncbi:MAG TPA: Na+/H+ antiporter [Gammaproteobacteria bacterium]|nr:Na+/H+ antiporter [Gammaproteobacteria bacterium]